MAKSDLKVVSYHKKKFYSVLKLFQWRLKLYSERRLLTGFLIAAFTAWVLIVTSAITIEAMPANANTHQPMLVRYAKSDNHFCMAHQATGNAISVAITMSNKKSFDNNFTSCMALAPSTFLIP